MSLCNGTSNESALMPYYALSITLAGFFLGGGGGGKMLKYVTVEHKTSVCHADGCWRS